MRTKINMDRLYNELGVSYKYYWKQDLYKMSFDQQKEFIAKKEEERRRQREYAIRLVMEETGWSHDFARDKMKDAKKRIGISFRQYYRYSFNEIPEKDQKKAWEEIVENRKNQKVPLSVRENLSKDRGKYIIKIMNSTGWSKDITERNVSKAEKVIDCLCREYYEYGLFNLTEKEQNEVLLLTHTEQLGAKYNTNNSFKDLLKNKEKTNKFFNKWLRRSWCVNTKTSFEEFKEKFHNKNIIVYKPIKGSMGKGLRFFDISEDHIKDIYDEIASLPYGVIEEYIVQHKDLIRLAPMSVNTLRIVTLSQIVDEKIKIDILFSSLRIGDGTRRVDNFHNGGMAAVIDLKTGKLITNAVNAKRETYEKHPFSGIETKGFKVPFFNEALEMVKEMISEKRVEGYIGWDVAVAEKGPVLVEANGLPGVGLLQAPYSHQKKGMKYVYEPYL